jgi:hypothetical protein
MSCTCNEPPWTGHLLWCDELIGRPEYRPRSADKVTAESLTDAQIRDEWHHDTTTVYNDCKQVLQRRFSPAQAAAARVRIAAAINARREGSK